MNAFEEKYQSVSDLELIKILENPEGYLPEAIEAAKNEMAKRNLTETEMTAVKNKFAEESAARQLKKENKDKAGQEIYKLLIWVYDAFHPFRDHITRAEKDIRSISIVLSIYAIFSIYNAMWLVSTVIIWDFYMVLFAASYLWFPAAIVLFWFRKRAGWLMLASFALYKAFSLIALMVSDWYFQSELYNLDHSFTFFSWAVQLFHILIYGGSCWLLAKERVRNVFSIDAIMAWAALIVTSLFIGISFGPYLLR